jgi:hypothetical protein
MDCTKGVPLDHTALTPGYQSAQLERATIIRKGVLIHALQPPPHMLLSTNTCLLRYARLMLNTADLTILTEIAIAASELLVLTETQEIARHTLLEHAISQGADIKRLLYEGGYFSVAELRELQRFVTRPVALPFARKALAALAYNPETIHYKMRLLQHAKRGGAKPENILNDMDLEGKIRSLDEASALLPLLTNRSTAELVANFVYTIELTTDDSHGEGNDTLLGQYTALLEMLVCYGMSEAALLVGLAPRLIEDLRAYQPVLFSATSAYDFALRVLQCADAAEHTPYVQTILREALAFGVNPDKFLDSTLPPYHFTVIEGLFPFLVTPQTLNAYAVQVARSQCWTYPYPTAELLDNKILLLKRLCDMGADKAKIVAGAKDSALLVDEIWHMQELLLTPRTAADFASWVPARVLLSLSAHVGYSSW